jgi:PAS domain-containing protein
MGHKPIELILLRQLVSRLSMPATLVDAEGSLVYFNPATERLLGVDQAALGEFPISSLDELIDGRNADGWPMEARDRPLSVALHDRRPQQLTMILHGSDGAPHRVLVTAIPLDGQGGALIGAMSVFWEEEVEVEVDR